MKKEMVVMLLIAAVALLLMPFSAYAVLIAPSGFVAPTPPTTCGTVATAAPPLPASLVGTWCGYDWCFAEVMTNSLLGSLLSSEPAIGGLIAKFAPPTMDLNGSSLIDNSPVADNWPIGTYPEAWDQTKTPPKLNSPVIHIVGNGMRDADSELGVLMAALTNETLDLSSSGGITHQMALDAWNNNSYTLSQCIGTYWSLLGPLVPGLEEILTGFCTMGDGSFAVGTLSAPGVFVPDPDQTNPTGQVYQVTGGGGFIGGLLFLLNTAIPLGDPTLIAPSNYTSLASYLASTGNASGRGGADKATVACNNYTVYQRYGLTDSTDPTVVAGIAAAYVSDALNPALTFSGCGEQIIIDKTTDTDHDGIPDWYEINGWWEIDHFTGLPVKYQTTPNNPDTDGGGVWDGVEMSLGLNPLDNTDDHLVPATSHNGLMLLGLMMGVAGVVALARIRKSRSAS